MTIPNPQTDRTGWLKWRQSVIGGSDAAAVVGKHPYKTKQELYTEKVSPIFRESDSLILQRGLAMEPLVAKRFERETGRKIRRQPARVHPWHDFIGCTIDYQVLSTDSDQTELLECKTANQYMFRKIRLEGLQEFQYLQAQHNLAVWGYDICWFAFLCPDTWEFIKFRVERNERIIDWLIEEEARFWFDHVLKRIPPDDDKPRRTEKIPEIGGDLVTLDTPDFMDAVDAYNQAKRIAKEAEELLGAAASKIQAVMADRKTDVIAGGGKIFYWREQAGRVSFDKVALQAAHPEIDLSAFEKRGKPFKSFRPYDYEPEA